MYTYLNLVPPVVFIDGLEFVLHYETLLRSCQYTLFITHSWSTHSWYGGLFHSSIHNVPTDDQTCSHEAKYDPITNFRFLQPLVINPRRGISALYVRLTVIDMVCDTITYSPLNR
jgi:hypothetical protein